MKKFLSEDFLLENDFSATLYHDYAAKMPIIDYHNHLPPQDIANNRKFSTITEAWLEGDHYKWRAMRTFGINEKYVTGDSSDQEKFLKWAETVPYTVRNPLYHWTHLEMKRYFGVNELLSPKTAESVYAACNEKLAQDSHSCQGLLQQMKVESLCTTDDPSDDLAYHKQIAESGISPKVYPTFRPDKTFAIETEGYKAYLQKLGESENTVISSFDLLLEVCQKRVDYFHSVGGRLSDHGIEELYLAEPSVGQSKTIFEKAIADQALSIEEVKVFKMTMMVELAKMYHAKGWVQQFHLGAIRNNNKRMLRELGPDTGFDSIGDYSQIRAISKFLDRLDNSDQLAKTILYNLNPRDNEAIATMIGNFNDGSVAGKIQFGSGWWFLDQKDGMERQMNALSNMGLLSQFVGMLTDSRSFLSYPRHEYFRRILCSLIGKDVTNGELPADEALLGEIVQNICYHNSKKYFQFES